MKSRNPLVSANAEPAPLAGEPERVIPSRSRPQRPSSVSLTRASSPGGEACNLPLRGRGTAAVGGGGRGALWKRAVRNFQPLPPEGEAQKTGAAWMAAPVS